MDENRLVWSVMTRIGILHGFNCRNKGDVAIVKAMISRLRDVIPDADIAIFSHIRADRDHSVSGASIVPSIISPENNRMLRKREFFKGPIATRILAILLTSMHICLYTLWGIIYRLVGRKALRLVSGERKRILSEHISVDIAISRGGGFLTDADTLTTGYGPTPRRLHVEWNLVFHLYFIFFAILLGKPTVIYAQSIGPFKRPLNAIMARYVLDKVSLITVREPQSRSILLDIGVRHPLIRVTADEAFLLDAVEEERISEIFTQENIDRTKRPLVGVNVRRWRTPFSSTPNRDYNRYKKGIVTMINHLTGKYGATVVLIPQTLNTTTETEIRSLARMPDKMRILSQYSPEEIKGVIGQMDLFIGTHMHSSIFSLSMCVPTILISYTFLHKTRSIAKMMGMEEWVVPIDSVYGESLEDRIDEIWRSREDVRKKIRKKLRKMERGAILNAVLVKEVIEKCAR